MASNADELRKLADRLAAIASSDLAVPMVEQLAEQWVDVSQREVPVDTGQTRARTGIAHVGGTRAHARGEVDSDTPYAGWVELRWHPYFTMGRDAAHKLAEQSGGSVETELRRVLESGGHPNPRRMIANG